MAIVHPFRAFRYTSKAGDLNSLVTQPYDKITPEMQARYLRLSPYNLVRIILGERYASDNDANNVYSRAAGYLKEWINEGILAQDPEPSLYVYSQEFTDPDSGETCIRQGFIGAGQVEEYSAGIVHRHEQTLAGPKKDRVELLRHTKAHFGQIFMLYPDPEREIDALLGEFAAQEPLACVTDDYGAAHRLWRISDAAAIRRIQEAMRNKKLVIADGHHRYETALAFSKESPLPGAQRVMMTFINMHSPGLRILATHRVLAGLPDFDPGKLTGGCFQVERLPSVEALKAALREQKPDGIRIGMVFASDPTGYLLSAPRPDGALDVSFLHQEILEKRLGIDQQAVSEQKYLQYVRGIDAAAELVRSGGAQAAFLLQPATVEQVAGVSLGGGVMPQKSTDFYPKLLSGMTIYKIDAE